MASTKRSHGKLRTDRQVVVVSANVAGSRDALHRLCGAAWDILLVQEHRCDEPSLASEQLLAGKVGVRGIWTVAKAHQSTRSGGLAILVRAPMLVVGLPHVTPDRTLWGRVQWTRSRALLVGNVYGHSYGPEQEDLNTQLDLLIAGELNGHGRVPWIIGGDWNRSPAACSHIAGTVIGTGRATQLFGKELDYFRVSRCSPPSTCTEAAEIGLPDHVAIQLAIDSPRLAHLGYRLRTIQRAQQPPSKDSAVVASPLPLDLDAAWQQWHQQAEEAYLSRFDEITDGMRGRGAFQLEPRTLGCPQTVDGTAVPAWWLRFHTLSQQISLVPTTPARRPKLGSSSFAGRSSGMKLRRLLGSHTLTRVPSDALVTNGGPNGPRKAWRKEPDLCTVGPNVPRRMAFGVLCIITRLLVPSIR